MSSGILIEGTTAMSLKNIIFCAATLLFTFPTKSSYTRTFELCIICFSSNKFIRIKTQLTKIKISNVWNNMAVEASFHFTIFSDLFTKQNSFWYIYVHQSMCKLWQSTTHWSSLVKEKLPGSLVAIRMFSFWPIKISKDLISPLQYLLKKLEYQQCKDI